MVMSMDQQARKELVALRNRHAAVAANVDNPTISRQIARAYADGINAAFIECNEHICLDESFLP
jgi:hypothetical protein